MRRTASTRGRWFRRDNTLAEIYRLHAVPLAHQPGEAWEYSWGVDVLGRVIEVVSGQPFDRFLQDRIFKPLHMVDTGFFVPEAKLARLVDPIPGLWPRPDTFMGRHQAHEALLRRGRAGLPPPPDYLRFAQMLVNGGELDGVRLLSAQDRAADENARPCHPTSASPATSASMSARRWATSSGLGFAIRTNPDFSLLPGAVGSSNWSGILGHVFLDRSGREAGRRADDPGRARQDRPLFRCHPQSCLRRVAGARAAVVFAGHRRWP